MEHKIDFQRNFQNSLSYNESERWTQLSSMIFSELVLILTAIFKFILSPVKYSFYHI